MKLYRTTLASAVGLALLLSACGDDAETTNATPAPASSVVSTSAAAAPASGATANATVKTATVPGFGTILVDNAGRTLYLFEKDSGTKTACANDPCKTNWPALAAGGTPSVGAGLDASLLSTVSGQVPGHVVYGGHLLYYYVGDKAPGDVNGISIPAWFPLDATGKKVEKSA